MTRTLSMIVAVLVAGSGVGPAAAVTPTGVDGTVLDEVTGAPVPNAHVALLSTENVHLVQGTVAGPDGTYAVHQLEPGTYFLYVIDPSGGHTAGFLGPPETVTVAPGAVTNVDVPMTPTTGALAGTVTSEGTGVPVAGAWVAGLDPSTGRFEQGTVADATGQYALGEVGVGPHLVLTLDPTGAHAPEFHDGRAGPDGATMVDVEPGGSSPVDPSLAPRVAPAPGTSVEGRVTASGSSAGIGGSWVVALAADTYMFAAGTTTDGNGQYSLDLAPGPYLLGFLDPTGSHEQEWYADQPYHGLADATPVAVPVGPPVVIDAELTPARGAVTGTLTEDGSGDPVPGAWVLAIGSERLRGTVTGPDGTYHLADLPSGNHRMTFVDPGGRRTQEYWDDSPDYSGAQPVGVVGGTTATADASLAVPPCSDAGAGCVPPFPSPIPGPGWSTYTIPPGAHSASVSRGAQATEPLAGLLIGGSVRTTRHYHFVFDPSAAYVLTNPTDPADQFDWNKLPGLSDCGDVDLSQNGFMFGWRWRLDTTPRRLEITAYANNDGVHLTPPAPMATLTADQLAARLPLWFEMAVSGDGTTYQFTVNGPGTRHATATLPRQCTGGAPFWQWAAGFYFGGTSTAPSQITGLVNEVP